MSIRKIVLCFISTCCACNPSTVQEEQIHSLNAYYVLATLHRVFSLYSTDNPSYNLGHWDFVLV